MTENTENTENIKFSYLTIREALEITSKTTDNTRDGLIELIGKNMFDTLCQLGYITEGATINLKEKKRIAVWKRTDQPSPYDESQEKIPGIGNLIYIYI